MSFEDFYLIGILASFLIGIFGLTFTKDNECNVHEIQCIFVLILSSFMSWIMAIILISSEVRSRSVEDE